MVTAVHVPTAHLLPDGRIAVQLHGWADAFLIVDGTGAARWAHGEITSDAQLLGPVGRPVDGELCELTIDAVDVDATLRAVDRAQGSIIDSVIGTLQRQHPEVLAQLATLQALVEQLRPAPSAAELARDLIALVGELLRPWVDHHGQPLRTVGALASSQQPADVARWVERAADLRQRSTAVTVGVQLAEVAEVAHAAMTGGRG